MPGTFGIIVGVSDKCVSLGLTRRLSTRLLLEASGYTHTHMNFAYEIRRSLDHKCQHMRHAQMRSALQLARKHENWLFSAHHVRTHAEWHFVRHHAWDVGFGSCYMHRYVHTTSRHARPHACTGGLSYNGHAAVFSMKPQAINTLTPKILHRAALRRGCMCKLRNFAMLNFHDGQCSVRSIASMRARCAVIAVSEHNRS